MVVLVEGLTKEHETKAVAHQISGVAGLQISLDSKYSPSNKPSAADVGADAAGSASASVSAHESKIDAHQISGVEGLRDELDALTGVSGGISEINDRLVVVEGKVSALEQRKSTCLVSAAGTGAPHETVVSQLPTPVIADRRYILPNPFGNSAPVICYAELLIGGVWADAGFTFSSAGGFGTKASYVQGVGVVVQTGSSRVGAGSSSAGGGHGTPSETASAPCRVFVRKLEG